MLSVYLIFVTFDPGTPPLLQYADGTFNKRTATSGSCGRFVRCYIALYKRIFPYYKKKLISENREDLT